MRRNAENKTLSEQAADQMIQYIQENGYGPGDKLPTEADLSRLLGVGRNTVREAVWVLASRNIVSVRQGSGTFVSEKQGLADDPFGFSFVEDRVQLTRDLMQIRVMLEPSIAALAAQNAEPEEIRQLEEILLEIEALIEAESDYSEKDTQFHAQIANCSHNTVVSRLIPVISSGVTVFAREVPSEEYKQTLLSHRAIYEAIRTRRAVEAQQAMHLHLLYNENRYTEEIRKENT